MKKLINRVKDFVVKHKNIFVFSVVVTLVVYITKVVSYLKGYDEATKDANDWWMNQHEEFLNTMAPKIGVKYVIERTDDLSGRTLGEYVDPHESIEYLKDRILTQEKLIKKLVTKEEE